MHLFILFIPHDDENTCHLFVCRCPVQLLSQLRAQGYRPRVHYLPPSAVQVLLEHLGTPEEFYEILRKA